ncbi:MAG TPA: hypothetical protein VMU04_02045 [Candidatus Acidoferrum sp.]|nr:hypothetical protein [Candidatus Acidoferrum sp.]
MKRFFLLALSVVTFAELGGGHALAWDYTYHRVINLAALANLPTNFPAFVRTPAATERIGFLSGEPDRWRNVRDISFSHCSAPDHYLDMEALEVYGLKPEALPPFRYEFAAELIGFRKAHPDKCPPINEARNEDHTRELIGFVPWAIAENYGKLKSNFSYLKTFEEHGGTPEEIANAKENIIYVMGTMGHYVGDAGQPLHTTVHHHGWVGANPQHYTTNASFHSWIDSGYLNKVGGVKPEDLQSKLHTAALVSIDGRPAKSEEMFQAAMLFVIGQNKLVEPLYQLEKDGKLSGEGDKGLQGKPFLVDQMAKSAQLLADIWYSAWQQAPPDIFLERQLAHRHREAPTGDKP